MSAADAPAQAPLRDELLADLHARHTGPQCVVDESTHTLEWVHRILPQVALRQLMRLDLPRLREVVRLQGIVTEQLAHLEDPRSARQALSAVRTAIPTWLHGVRRDGLGGYLRVRLEALERYAAETTGTSSADGAAALR